MAKLKYFKHITNNINDSIRVEYSPVWKQYVLYFGDSNDPWAKTSLRIDKDNLKFTAANVKYNIEEYIKEKYGDMDFVDYLSLWNMIWPSIKAKIISATSNIR